MAKLSKYQQEILTAVKNGAYLQCTEGKNYKTWLVFKDGTTKTVRRDSANFIANTFQNNLIFGDRKGIYWRK